MINRIALGWVFVSGIAFAADPVEILVDLPQQPSLLSVHVEQGKESHSEGWSKTVQAIFEFADVNRDGAIEPSEGARIPSALRTRQLGWGYFWAIPDSPEWKELDTNGDCKATPQELAAYYRRHHVDEAQLALGQSASTEELNKAILKQLDTDKDGVITEKEWHNAATALSVLDQNEDELIRPEELVARILHPGTAGGTLLLPMTSLSEWPKPMMESPLIRLPRELTTATKFPVRKFHHSPDRNGDGQLDSQELNELRRLKDNVVTVFRFPHGTSKEPTVRIPPKGFHLVAYTVAPNATAEFDAALKTSLAKFASADRNGDDRLDAEETKAADYAPLRDHFRIADRDTDGLLTKVEWTEYLSFRKRILASQIIITCYDHQQSLFETLDADSDGALSVRELRNAVNVLKALGCMPEGKYHPEKLPVSFRFVASQGKPASYAHVPVRSAPEWFTAMDRNRDGDISKREFIGTETAFRKYDRDGDGLISIEEAGHAVRP